MTNLEDFRMDLRRLYCMAALLLTCGWGGLLASTAAAQSPTPEMALRFAPIQPFVDYAKPTPEEIRQCTIRPEKEGNVTSWVVRSGQGEILRRFADTNSDNNVDQWCYFLDGLEVYRDIDSNFNKGADQFRWFHTAGSRWGIDKDENDKIVKIDAWRVISPHEVAEQLVIALKTRDQARFNLLLLTPAELGELGLGKQRSDGVAASIQAANSGFAKLAAEQKVIAPQSTFIDFGSARPAAIPAGTAGSTKDLIVCDNATALVQVGGKHEQVYLGTLVSVGNTWKLIDLPVVGPDQQSPSPFLMAPDTPADRAPVNPNAPTEEMQKLLAELERLDKLAEGLPADQLAANVEQRAELLNRLVEATTDPDLKSQWLRQMTDMYFVAVQSGNYPQGVERLGQQEKRLQEAGAEDELIAHATFQRMWAANAVSQAQPGADSAKLQEKWLADLQEFVTNHQKSTDSAEALLQLGMFQEFNGKTDEARKWYTQLNTSFPQAPPAAKARGALRRLSLVGRPMQLRGESLQGGTVDLGAYRGKVVLIQFWATWAERSKEDMILLKDFYVKNASRGFDIIGVNLDDSPAPAKQFLGENRVMWKQLHEQGGLDGRLANELGVMTVPLMLLVDDKGNVVNDNIHVAELDVELNKLLVKPEADANALRQPTNPPR
jgi:thiol-disulfide isomerase/thioredoxin